MLLGVPIIVGHLSESTLDDLRCASLYLSLFALPADLMTGTVEKYRKPTIRISSRLSLTCNTFLAGHFERGRFHWKSWRADGEDCDINVCCSIVASSIRYFCKNYPVSELPRLHMEEICRLQSGLLMNNCRSSKDPTPDINNIDPSRDSL